jgi:hypothetical protein
VYNPTTDLEWELQAKVDRLETNLTILSERLVEHGLEPLAYDRPKPLSKSKWKKVVNQWMDGVKLQYWDLSNPDQEDWYADPDVGGVMYYHDDLTVYRVDPEFNKGE